MDYAKELADLEEQRGMRILAERNYPGLKHSRVCSIHRDSGRYECPILVGDLRVRQLRIKLIEMEHDLARAQGRKPKTNDELFHD